MGLTTWIKDVWNKMFKTEIERLFDTDVQLSTDMELWIRKFYDITSGRPFWNDKEDDIESINFAGFAGDVTAGLVTLDLGIEMPDTARGEYLQKQADYVLQVITDKVSEGLGNAGLMFKPNGRTIDYIEPGSFALTDTDSNGNILGCIFQSSVRHGGYTYTRFEWQRYEGEGEERVYRITNYAYKVKGEATDRNVGKVCPLSEVSEWADIEPDVSLVNIERPLFAFFKNPAPNRIDRTSPLGVPVWFNALKELQDLDVAWSRKAGETKDSKHITFLPQTVVKYADARRIKLPRFVKGAEYGTQNGDDKIHEHVATLLTEQRIKDINSILAMISTKCGFSQGMFVIDEKTGIMTATQVEADDQETIRTIKNIRDSLRNTMDGLFYGINVMTDLYTDIPAENWDTLKESIVYNWGDITYSYNEDKANWWKYRIQGDVPPWMYYMKFEGMSESDARKMVEEAQPKEPMLFEEE